MQPPLTNKFYLVVFVERQQDGKDSNLYFWSWKPGCCLCTTDLRSREPGVRFELTVFLVPIYKIGAIDHYANPAKSETIP